MRLLRALLLAGSSILLLPSLASATPATPTASCVSPWVAVGLAMLPPEAITDYAREILTDGGGKKGGE